MCNKGVDDFLPALKFVPDWFITSKIIKNFLTALYADENKLNFIENSGDVVFSCNKMGILSIDLNNINLADMNYDEDDPETIIHIILFIKRVKWRINAYSVASWKMVEFLYVRGLEKKIELIFTE